MCCPFLVWMDPSFTFHLCNLKTPLIGQSHRLSNKRGFTVYHSYEPAVFNNKKIISKWKFDLKTRAVQHGVLRKMYGKWKLNNK